jgi:hypothetical protein
LQAAYTRPPFDPTTVEALLLAHLPAQLTPMLSRTMALELNIARLQGLLVGDTPEERFHSFAQRLRDPATALALLQEYPVLARPPTDPQRGTVGDHKPRISRTAVCRLGSHPADVQSRG